MENEELVSLVWEFLATLDKPQTSQELEDLTGQPAVKVQRILGSFKNEKLVDISNSNGALHYRAILELDALRWAQAVGLGVNILLLEKYASLSQKDKTLALKMTVDGSIERVEEERRQEKIAIRQEVIRGKAASKAAASELAKILKDTESALSYAVSAGEVAKKKNSKEESLAIQKILEQAHSQTRKAFDGLVESLARR